jgi:hypothetical protein
MLSVDSRPVRELGNSVGQTFDMSAMKKLGVVDDDGNLDGEVEALQTVYSDGRIEIELDISD